jgi:hypothetical protein
MKTTTTHFLFITALVGAVAISGAFAQEATFDKLANLPMKEGRPTKETAQTLRDDLLFQRATQTYLWALPLIEEECPEPKVAKFVFGCRLPVSLCPT